MNRTAKLAAILAAAGVALTLSAGATSAAPTRIAATQGTPDTIEQPVITMTL